MTDILSDFIIKTITFEGDGFDSALEAGLAEMQKSEENLLAFYMMNPARVTALCAEFRIRQGIRWDSNNIEITDVAKDAMAELVYGQLYKKLKNTYLKGVEEKCQKQ